MTFWTYFSFLKRYVTLELDNDAAQPPNDYGMHIIYDGTNYNNHQSLLQDTNNKPPCLEPVDIIAVHGLEGHHFATWLHPETEAMWLRDLLPVATPISRIMSYGYDAKVYQSRSTLHIMHKAQDLLYEIKARRDTPSLQNRRIVFVGHSMGGILIKKALTMARDEKKYQGILHSTNGIMFMGTPHDGADAAKLASTLAHIAESVKTINREQLDMLKRDSESLQEISRNFGFLDNLKIVTVIESNKTRIPYTGKYILIVPQASALLNLGDRETVLSVVNADHHMVCKFPGQDDRQYLKVRSAISDLAASSEMSMSTDLVNHQKRLRSIDASINQGNRKIQKTMDEGFNQTNSSLSMLEANSERRRIAQILSNLPQSSSKSLEKAPTIRHGFLQTKEFISWQEGSSSFLWLHGKSGAGKTALSSAIYEHVSKLCQSEQDDAAATSVYCSYTDHDVESVICTLVSGLIATMPLIPLEASQCIQRCRANRFNENDLTESLRCILLHLKCAFLIIDGLDEWPSHGDRRSSLLSWITKLKGWRIPHLHVLITSQHTPDVAEALQSMNSCPIDPHLDIYKYIRHQLDTDPKLARYDDDLKIDIENSLLAGSDGVFRWVVLQFMELKSCATSRDVRKALQNLPKTLIKTYDRILGSVPQRDQFYVHAALQWIACSMRPLTPDELAVVATINPARRYDPTIQFFEQGRTICQMLSRLIIVEDIECFDDFFDWVKPPSREFESIKEISDILTRRMLNVEIPGRSVVKFSHSSIRTYLLQSQRHAALPNSPHVFSFSVNTANQFISQSCLAFMQFCYSMNRQECPERLANPLVPQCLVIYLYISRHWGEHAAFLPNEEPGSLFHLFNRIPLAVDNLMRTHDKFSRSEIGGILEWDYNRERAPSPEIQIQYAACCGCMHLIAGVLDQYPDADVNARLEFSHADNALSLACEREHWQVVETLLRRGADPNNHDDERAIPLLLAIEGGNYSVVRKLIAHNADVNVAEIWDATTPLAAAVEAGHSNIVTLLLRNGAWPGPDSDNECIRPLPLSVAARSGRAECMAILLRYGATFKRSRYETSSLLELASRSGSLETVQLLLDHELDPNSETLDEPLEEDLVRSDHYYTLNYPGVTIQEGHHSTSNENYGSPIHAAAAYGHTKIIKLLIENGAAVDKKSYYWGTPANLARWKGHKASLDFLSLNGAATVDLPDVCYRQDRFRKFSTDDAESIGSKGKYQILQLCEGCRYDQTTLAYCDSNLNLI